MSKRYSVMVRYPMQDRYVELLQVDNNPEALVEKLKEKAIGTGRARIAVYEHVKIVDHEAPKG